MKEENWQSRTRLLIGEEGIEKLREAHLFVAGLGGVGGYAAEQLCRAGIGKLSLVDCDVVQPSNRNRQLIALRTTEGKRKTELFKSRLLAINPDIVLNIKDEFLDDDTIPSVLEEEFDYVLDAIDTLSPKASLLAEAVNRGYRVISSMGSGGKTDPAQVRIADIENSHSCKLAYKTRKLLHAKGIRSGIKVVYSPEQVSRSALVRTDGSNNKRSIIGTISYMPAIFGCFAASEIIRDLLQTIRSEEN